MRGGTLMVARTHPRPEWSTESNLSSPPSVLDRHSQNAARSFYRWALIAAILHAVGKWLQTPAFVEGRSHGRQVCDNLRRGALGHGRKWFVCGLGSLERT